MINVWVNTFQIEREDGRDEQYGFHLPVVFICTCNVWLIFFLLFSFQDLDLKIKWSNDIVFGGHIKLGGVLVNSMIINGVLHAIIGKYHQYLVQS